MRLAGVTDTPITAETGSKSNEATVTLAKNKAQRTFLYHPLNLGDKRAETPHSSPSRLLPTFIYNLLVLLLLHQLGGNETFPVIIICQAKSLNRPVSQSASAQDSAPNFSNSARLASNRLAPARLMVSENCNKE